MIRQAKTKDVEDLCHLLHQLGYASELSQIEQALAEGNKDSSSRIYVYELSGKAVGFISVIRFFYFPVLKYVTRITAICVDEQYRGLSIGSELLNFAEEFAVNFGDISVEVTCSMKREKTHRFYLRHGYSQCSYKFVKQLMT